MHYRFRYVGADLCYTSPSARYQQTLQDHGCACLLPQLSLSTHATYPRGMAKAE